MMEVTIRIKRHIKLCWK